jgi:hypothetical protein
MATVQPVDTSWTVPYHIVMWSVYSIGLIMVLVVWMMN